MIKTMHHRNLNKRAGLIFFLSTAYQNKANPIGFIFSHAPNSIYAFNQLQNYLTCIHKTAQQKLSNRTSHASII